MAASPEPEPLKIFISHSTADLEAARRVHRALRDAGLRVWLREEDLREEGVELGATWREAVDEALQASDVILILLSRQGFNDKSQAWDLELARSEEKRVVPALLEANVFPEGIFLGRLGPYLEFLKERRGEVIDSAEGLAKLIHGLQRLNEKKTGLKVEGWP
jgi:hypothetical protein